MATKSFGSTDQPEQKTPVQELYDAVGATFPVSMHFNRDGEIIAAEYETTWKEGSVKTTEKLAKDGSVTYENKGEYENNKLTTAQIKKADEWLSEHVVTAGS